MSKSIESRFIIARANSASSSVTKTTGANATPFSASISSRPMPLMTVRSSRQTMGMRMPWRCSVRARLRAYWIHRPEFTRQRSFTATSAGLRQRRKASLPTSLSGIRAASAWMSSDCSSLVTRPGVLLKSKSLVARLNTMLSALRWSRSSALVRDTGTCVAPMREATRWRW